MTVSYMPEPAMTHPGLTTQDFIVAVRNVPGPRLTPRFVRPCKFDITASNFSRVLPSYGSLCVPEPAKPSVRIAIQTDCAGVGRGVGDETGVADGAGVGTGVGVGVGRAIGLIVTDALRAVSSRNVFPD